MDFSGSKLLLLVLAMVDTFSGTQKGFVVAQRCTPNIPALTNPPPREKRALPQKKQFIVPQYTFGCHGRLTKWEARVEGMNPTVIHFQVWRYKRESRNFEVVGENVYPGVNGIKHRVEFYVSTRDQIIVQPRDIVGVYVEYEVPGDFRMLLDLSDLYDAIEVYLVEVEEEVLISSFNPLSDNPAYEVVNGAPLVRPTIMPGDIQVITNTSTVVPTQTTSGQVSSTTFASGIATTPTPNLPQDKSNNNSSKYQTKLIIGIGVSGGVLVLCFCALIVMVMLYARIRYVYKTKRIGLSRGSRADSNRYPSILTLLSLREPLSQRNSSNDSATNSKATSLTNSMADDKAMQSTSFQTFHPPSPEQDECKSDVLSDDNSSRVGLIKLRENPCYSPLPAAPVYDITHGSGTKLSGKNGAAQNAFCEKKPKSGRGGVDETDDGRVYDLPIVLNKTSKPFEYEIPTTQSHELPPETNDHIYAEIH